MSASVPASVSNSAASSQLVTVFGGSGFVGRHVVRVLAQRGYRVRVAVRRPDLAMHLLPLGTPGQIQLTQANVRYRSSIQAAVKGADCVVNAVGILFERGSQKFQAVQALGAHMIAEAAAAAGVRSLVHLSAIGADEKAEAAYARSKAEGELAVLNAFPNAVILRPSVVFGSDDDFFNRFAALAQLAPALPLIGGGKTRFQPIYVGDVAEAVAQAVMGHAKPGTVYELGGADILTFKDILDVTLKHIGRQRLLLPVPFAVASFQAFFLQFLPKPLLTPDQVTLLKTDNVVTDAAAREGRTLQGLGVTPTPLAAVLPGYLWRYRKDGQFFQQAA